MRRCALTVAHTRCRGFIEISREQGNSPVLFQLAPDKDKDVVLGSQELVRNIAANLREGVGATLRARCRCAAAT